MHLRINHRSSIGALILVSLLWLWAGPQISHAQGGPTVNVNPGSGVAGNVLQLGASGFAPGGYVGTILWDGVAVETVQIPTGGSFVTTFVIPSDAAPANHVITLCRGAPCGSGGVLQQASAQVQVTASLPQLDSNVAYVYRDDVATAKNFATLLEEHGMTVSVLTLDAVLKTDFRRFALTIIADDTGDRANWGTASGQVDTIAENSKVLGLGEGGYAFFGQVKNALGQPGLAIGHPRGAHGSALDVYPVDPNLAFYRTAYNTGAASGMALQVYTDNVPNVAIAASNLGSDTFPTGYEDDNGTYSILVGQGCRQLWGFAAGPEKMTVNGRNLFVNAVQQAMSMPCSATLQNPCQEIFSPADIPVAGRIAFDDLPEATVIENAYAALYGVRFANNRTTSAVTYGKIPDNAASQPNVARNEAAIPSTNASVPFVINFDEPKTHVGFYMGNGGTVQPNGLLTAYDSAGSLLCRASNPVPNAHTEFIGLYDAYGRIASIYLDYGSALPESLDNLTFAPNPQGWRIQLCQETTDGCPQAPGTVYRINPATGGDAFAIDEQGYVLGASAIAIGDQLWGVSPMTATANTTVYRTSGDPATVSAALVSGEPGTLRLVVKQAQPLLVHNLDVSAEWYVQGDASKAAWLRASMIDAANYLYSFTDGQFTLGKITVHQSLDEWQTADLRLHINNSLQPKAVIGGVVATDTVDPSPTVDYVYSPGHLFMGSHWNRYGLPPNQPVMDNGVIVPPATMAKDWAMAMAHELGHYLLFLFDTYTDVDGNASQELAELCSGGAMGDVYQPSNQNFIFDLDHWHGACNGTEAYHTLQGRTEWATIHLWYPWVIRPTSVVAGPAAPPVNLTTVTFVAPSTPPGEPAASQIFDMIYQDGELSSGEARVFTLRGDRVFEQGKPPKDATQVELIDAQIADRLCVYDINDHSENSETPRHQFGCEIIQPGDAELMMTKNVAWGPLVKLTQTGPNQMSMVVTNSLTTPITGQIMARLYPEQGTGYAPGALTGDNGVYSGVFDLPEAVPPVYAQLWVEETPPGLITRREVMMDRGTGGSGAFGPARHLGGVLVLSSDGKASFESDEPLELGAGESIAWQSMPGTPPLPFSKSILGQSYRLDAFPPSLVAAGRVSIEYEAPAVLQAASLQGMQVGEPALYFWNGSSWQALPTTLTTSVNAPDGVRVASAASQGVGVYAVLVDLGENQLFLPLIQQ